MKKISLLISTLSIMGFSGFIFWEDFLSRLEITRRDAEEHIWSSFSSGYFSYPWGYDYFGIDNAIRVTLVREIGDFAKMYTLSDHFKNKYEEYRNSQKPSPPDPPQSVEEMRNQYKTDLQESIRDSEASLRNYTGEMRIAMEEAISAMKVQLKELDDPDNPMFSQEAQEYLNESYKLRLEEYETQLKEWEQIFPSNSRDLVKGQLSYFIELSETVDFSAKLTKTSWGTWVFVNPDYESQSPDWKMLYRAGKESVDAARSYAKQWLSEL